MALTEALRILIDADSAGAVRGLQQVGSTAERELGKADKSLSRLGSQFTTVGAAAIGLGSVALVGLGAAAMASEDAHLAVVKLENTLKNMPQLAGENSKQFIDLADSIQDVTAADADAIVEAEALLGTFRLTADEIKRITPLVVDYSRKFGVDLADAAVQVGKALDGNVTALKRNGVSIDETAFATDRYTAVQQALRDQVGGFAEEEGKTFAGSLERLKNQLGDVVEGVGTGAVDAFSSMFGVVDGLTDRFNELSPSTQNLVGQVATFGSVGLIAAGGASVLIGQVIKMHERFGLARDAVSSFVGAGGLGGLARTVGKGGIVIGALLTLEEVFDAVFGDQTGVAEANIGRLEAGLLRFGRTGQVTGELLEVVGEDFGRLKDALGDIDVTGIEGARASVDRFAASIPGVGRALDTGFAENIDEAKQTLSDFDDALARIAGEDPERAFDILSSAAEALGVNVSDLMPALDAYDGVLGDVAAAAEQAGVPVDEFGRALDGNAESAEAAKAAIDAYRTEIDAMFDPVLGFASAERDLNEALQRQAEVYANAESTAWDKAAADQAVTEAVIGLDSAAEELNTQVAMGNLSLADARSRLIAMATAAGVSQAEAVRLADQLLQTTHRANELGASDPTVDVTANTYGARLGIAGVGQALNDIDGRVATVTVKQLFQSVGDLFGFAGGRAHGGPVSGGRLYEVAEQGRAELLEMAGRTYLIPGSDGTVVPAGGWGGGGGGGGQVVNVNYSLNFHGPTNDTQVIESIKRFERSNGSDWRR